MNAWQPLFRAIVVWAARVIHNGSREMSVRLPGLVDEFEGQGIGYGVIVVFRMIKNRNSAFDQFAGRKSAVIVMTCV